jgi:hypothetical protein
VSANYSLAQLDRVDFWLVKMLVPSVSGATGVVLQDGGPNLTGATAAMRWLALSDGERCP